MRESDLDEVLAIAEPAGKNAVEWAAAFCRGPATRYTLGDDEASRDLMLAWFEKAMATASREQAVMSAKLAEALRLTQEYLGSKVLPPVRGWSWYDALSDYYGEPFLPADQRPMPLGDGTRTIDPAWGPDLIRSLANAGIVPRTTRKVIIEASYEDFVMVYVESAVDDGAALLSVVRSSISPAKVEETPRG